MAVLSIDQLNARRARMPASGGANYAKHDRLINPVDVRAQDAAMDAGERLHEQVRLVFAEYRAWFAESTNAIRAGAFADDTETAIPF